MDKKFDPYLDGTVVDFYDDLEKHGFVFNNPNSAETCCCGSIPGLTAGCMMAMRDVAVMAKVRRQAAEWAALIDEWRQSGLSLPELCQRNGLSRGTIRDSVSSRDVGSQIAGLPLRSARGSKAFRVRGRGDQPTSGSWKKAAVHASRRRPDQRTGHRSGKARGSPP